MTEIANSRALLRDAARRLGFPLWRRLRPHVDTIVARRVDRHTERLMAELERLRGEVRRLSASDESTRAELGGLGERVAWTENETRRMASHLAAADERIAGIERRPPLPYRGDIQHQQAKTLIEEVRDEHARIRARLTAVSRYEERIGRLEAALRPNRDRVR